MRRVDSFSASDERNPAIRGLRSSPAAALASDERDPAMEGSRSLPRPVWPGPAVSAGGAQRRGKTRAQGGQVGVIALAAGVERGGGDVERAVGPVLAHGAVGESAAPERIAEHRIVHVAVALPEPAGTMVVELVADIDVPDVGAGHATGAGGGRLDLVVQEIGLLVDPVGLVAADPGDAVAATVALHQPGVAEHPHGDVRVLLTDGPVDLGEILPKLVEISHLVPRRLVAPSRRDAPNQCIRPVLVTDGAQVVAPDRDGHECAVTVAGDAGSAHLGGNLTDHRAGTGDEHRLDIEPVGQSGTRRLVEFTLAGA